jgi:hypothetical protein
MNWGSGIATLYIGFVVLVGTMVTMSFGHKNDLVSEQYYEKELAFQERINAMNNTANLKKPVRHEFSAKELLIFLPVDSGGTLTGEILFFRPADASKDYDCAVETDQKGVQKIPLERLTKGMYKMQISWENENTPYYSEQIIVIP